MIITWQAGSQTAENLKNFSIISEWWKSINKKSVLWKQRLLPETGDIDWKPKRFDDTFVLAEADVRGISFYWKKTGSEDLSNITPAKLEFNPALQRLYLYPETQKTLIISVEIPGTARETIKMKNPSWFSEKISTDTENIPGYRLIIFDSANQIEVQIKMDEGSLNFLKNSICGL